MLENRWDPNKKMPWNFIRSEWEKVFDLSKPILLEKSPPNLVRAADIQLHFELPLFVAMMRNPYAYCEGSIRRQKDTIEGSAIRWQWYADYQRRNIMTLDNLLFFTYEQFTNDPIRIRAELIKFAPELDSLDISRPLQARSIYGLESRKIENLNSIKIQQLGPDELERITRVLRTRNDLMDFYGYGLLL